jgi:hypothetical protein
MCRGKVSLGGVNNIATENDYQVFQINTGSRALRERVFARSCGRSSLV